MKTKNNSAKGGSASGGKNIKKKSAKKSIPKKTAKPKSRTKAASKKKKVAVKTMTIAATKNVIKKTLTGFVEKTPRISPKHFAYVALSMILGLMAGLIVCLFTGLTYIRYGSFQPNFIILGFACYLPVPLAILFLFGGLAFGIWLGFWGWRVVYVEHRR